MNVINQQDDEDGETSAKEAMAIASGQGLYDYESQVSLSTYETPLYDYNQLMLNFGFVSMFAGAWPLTPMVVMVYNFSQTYIDQKKLMTQFQRSLCPLS